MSVPARVSLVTLGVSDVAAASRFYASLGWSPSPASVPDVVTFFATDGGQLALFGRDALATDAGVPPGPATTGVALAINCDTRDQVDDVAATWAAAGGTVVKAPTAAQEFEGYSAYLADPDGHLWEIAWNPGFPIGADGRPTLP